MAQRIFNRPYLKLWRRQLRYNQTDAERILWRQLRNKQLGGVKFRRQFSVGPYILDFYCTEKHIAIELDGSQHLDSINYDSVRDQYLLSKNIRTLRFWNNEVMQNMNGVLERILSLVTNEPPPTSPFAGGEKKR